MTKKCIVIPKKYRSITDVLLKNKRIREKMTLDNLSIKEVKRCMSNAEVFEILNNDADNPVLLHEQNYYKDNTVVVPAPPTPDPTPDEGENTEEPTV